MPYNSSSNTNDFLVVSSSNVVTSAQNPQDTWRRWTSFLDRNFLSSSFCIDLETEQTNVKMHMMLILTYYRYTLVSFLWWQHTGLVGSMLDFQSKGQWFESGLWCSVSLDRNFIAYCLGCKWAPVITMLREGVTLRWTTIPSTGE